MIVLFTDYGINGPYIGQVEAAILRDNPSAKIINLLANAPRNNPRASSYLLASYSLGFPEGSIFFCVVDPGVGSFEDRPLVVEADGKTYIGPDNGLFDMVVRRSKAINVKEILWQPDTLSNSFHGRDLYAPVCSMLNRGEEPLLKSVSWSDPREYPDELNEIIYVDQFGNCITGTRARNVKSTTILECASNRIEFAPTFSAVKQGQVFWYENANGLGEIAVNGGSAESYLEVGIGDSFRAV